MLDFTEVSSSSKQDAFQGIPDQTLLLCKLRLEEKSYTCSTEEPYMVKDENYTHLVKFCFSLEVLSPAKWKGRLLEGSKPVTASLQRKFGCDYVGVERDCAKGDRAVKAILAFDCFCKQKPYFCKMSSYAELAGKYCLARIGSFKGIKSVQLFMDPTNDKDAQMCALMLAQYKDERRAATGAPGAAALPASPAPAAVPAAPAAPAAAPAQSSWPFPSSGPVQDALPVQDASQEGEDIPF